ncbi:XRE family transcriptional regulator [Phyllobacterium leguminum]|uniref:Peptidase S24-like protein n=1 Tax=Phyllobacterium leguminum TaxID=314237 RepID=A0A318T5N5_9HYPH|nr:LexA family transcriptional regulator [Phyllobacterium leguminum]PYE89625.1 peptidase S24-like protein [Phyllobacterium leguminum]
MLNDVIERIDIRLKALGLSAQAASIKAGLSKDAIRNMQRAVQQKGRSGVSTRTITALAPVLETSVAWLLEGIGDPGDTASKPSIISSFDPDAAHDHEELGMSYGLHTGFHGAPEGTSPQIDITGGMGAGGLSIVKEGVPGKNGMTFSADAVSDYWRLPPAIYSALGLNPKDAAFVPVQGDSMYPTLQEGDVVVIDTRHRWPSPDGVYAILDEIGGLVMKRLEVVDEDGENKIHIISDNPRHPVKVKKPDDLFVVGRVLRRFGIIK